MVEITLGGVASAAFSRLQNVSAEMVEFCQRVAILVSDVVFIVAAFFAQWEWKCDGCHCTQPLRVYAIGCVVICFFDSLLEISRCLLEGSLDQLQSEYSNASPNPVSDRGLLGEDTLARGEPGTASAARTLRRTMLSLPHANPWNYIVQEKSSKQKRMVVLSRLSIVLTTVVALIYSLLSARDEACAREMAYLNSYVRSFSYVFILRLGVVILGICCRTVKDYEDAAGNGPDFTQAQGVAMNDM